MCFLFEQKPSLCWARDHEFHQRWCLQDGINPIHFFSSISPLPPPPYPTTSPPSLLFAAPNPFLLLHLLIPQNLSFLFTLCKLDQNRKFTNQRSLLQPNAPCLLIWIQTFCLSHISKLLSFLIGGLPFKMNLVLYKKNVLGPLVLVHPS